MQIRFDSLVLVLAMAGVELGLAERGQAEDIVRSFTESVTLETAGAVEKKFATVRDYIAGKQWSQAVEVLRQTTRDDGDSLFRVSPGRYLNVRQFCHLVLCGWPRAGLQVYRGQVDAEASILFKTGQKSGDDGPLHKLLRNFFASSYGDDALLLLADRAWRRGKIEQARQYWEQSLALREPTKPGEPGEPLPVLRYPDSSFAPAETLARLVLCSLAEGNLSRAERELTAFRRMYPAAVGTVGGHRGKLTDLLSAVANNARRWTFAVPDDAVSTFALNARRNQRLFQPATVEAVVWSVPLPVVKTRTQRFRRVGPIPIPSHFYPVLFGDVVLLGNAEQIRAWNVRTGKPAWPIVDDAANGGDGDDGSGGGDHDDAVIYPPVPDESGRRSSGPTVGVSRFSMTVDDGRLYAKMGTPITARSKGDRFGNLHSDLVCLDLARGQGKLVWKISASEAQPGWTFEGSPVVNRGRLFAVLRRRSPSTQLNVACYIAETGQTLWNRKVCATLDAVSESYNVISHLLLTVGGGALYLSTGFGAVASLDQSDGTLRWVTTYPRQSIQRPATLNDPRHQSLKPCLYHRGTVIAAPNDSPNLFALDAETGAIRWRTEPRGGLRHLLGVAGDRLIVSGRRLWAFDIHSGRVVWQMGFENPVGHGYGRGILAGRFVYWPTREELFVVDQQTGDVRRRIPLRKVHRQTGGNLTIAHGLLLIAGPNRLTAFGPSGIRQPPPVERFPFNVARRNFRR